MTAEDALAEVGAARTHLVGTRIPRREDPRLLTGNARYVGDITLPRLTHAAFVRSPHAHAVVTGIDADEAHGAPGVVAVFTAADFPDVTFVDFVAAPGLKKTPQPPLAGTRVRFVGEPVVVVVAESRALAEDAADLVDVAYEPIRAYTDVETAAPATDDLLFGELGSNVIYHRERTIGEVDQAFARADHVVSGTYRGNRFVAAPMEGAGIVASHDAASGSLTVWAATQAPHLLRTRLAAATGIAENRIRVVVPDVGGGFGQKIPIRAEEAAVALAATRIDRPVRWIEDRYENLIAAPHAKEQGITVELALADDGTFLGIRADIVGDPGAYSHNTASALIEPHHASMLMPGVYRIHNYAYEVSAVLTNKSPVAPYRGIGWTAGHAARELVIDKAARLLGRDPAELRLQNMIRSDEFPYTSCTGMVYDSGSHRESLEVVMDTLDYGRLREEQVAARAGGRYLGIGLSPFVEPTAYGTEGARESGSSSFVSHDAARVSMDASGNVTVAVGMTSQGQGHETTLCQVAADQLGVDLEATTLLANDTHSAPISVPGTRASRTAVVAGGGVLLAAQELQEKLRAIAGALLEADPDDLEVTDGRIGVVGDPESSLTVREVAHAAYYNADIRETVPEPHLTVTRFYDPKATYTNGCFGAVVEVDPETGGVRLERFVAVEDCGTIINPLIVDGQVQGAVAQGVGGALLEQMVYGDDGQIRTSTFMDYLLPTAAELPTIEVAHLSSPSPNTPGGVKGMGESGVIGTPAAVANAVADALAPFGVEVQTMPLTPQTVVRMIEEAHRED